VRFDRREFNCVDDMALSIKKRASNLTRFSPSYFKLHVRWLSSLTPVTYLTKLLGFTALPPACNSNYLGERF
jgi:hypothetical protein